MSVLDHILPKAAPAERGDFDSGHKALSAVKVGLLVLAGVIGTACAIALDPIVNIFAGG